MFCFVLFCFVLFCFVLSCFVLLCSVSFILFCLVLSGDCLVLFCVAIVPPFTTHERRITKKGGMLQQRDRVAQAIIA
jgi:hypothetical protein